MPPFLAIATIHQITDAVNGTMNTARATMILALTTQTKYEPGTVTAAMRPQQAAPPRRAFWPATGNLFSPAESPAKTRVATRRLHTARAMKSSARVLPSRTGGVHLGSVGRRPLSWTKAVSDGKGTSREVDDATVREPTSPRAGSSRRRRLPMRVVQCSPGAEYSGRPQPGVYPIGLDSILLTVSMNTLMSQSGTSTIRTAQATRCALTRKSLCSH